MDDKNQAIRELHEKIADLARKQKNFQDEIQRLQNAVFELEIKERNETTKVSVTSQTALPKASIEPIKLPVEDVVVKHVITPPTAQPSRPVTAPAARPPRPSNAWEEFIGTNLLNKIGIAILVIGIGFGVKYSIDHQLMGPITRIILGYFAAIALVILAIRLKTKHKNFSAVLLSGGMAVLYFITYAAYDFYDLIPQMMAFALMVTFTGFTVFAALQYDTEVLAIIGLVGAYAVPLLLSDGSGRVVILFSYVTVINTGILTLAFKKYWKRLYYLAFFFTWLIFALWHIDRYSVEQHLTISLGFGTIFFITFYTTFLAYKLIREEPLNKPDLFFMLANSFVFYGFGYASIALSENGDLYLGLFTLATAVLHFIACVIIYRRQTKFGDSFYFVAGMVLVFLTLAVPVQLEGNWVTLVWAAEAALLFWIGRTKGFPVYEKLSYPLIVLALISLVHDWDETYTQDYIYNYKTITHPLFLNIQFATSIIVALSIAFVVRIDRKHMEQSPWTKMKDVQNLVAYGLPATLIIILYGSIFREIEFYYNLRYAASAIDFHREYGVDTIWDQDILNFRNLWLICYSAWFALLVSVVQLRFVKSRGLMLASLCLNAAVVAAFVTAGLYDASILRSSFIDAANEPYYIRDIGHIAIRYVGIISIVPLLIANFVYLRDPWFHPGLKDLERVLFHLVVLIILSSELVHWLEISSVQNTFKLGLSILWGAYALFLVILGLVKKEKTIRIAAMVLFGVTLVKLFLYDMADMTTISKTIVMIILGVLLLIASFLYNKFKTANSNEVA